MNALEYADPASRPFGESSEGTISGTTWTNHPDGVRALELWTCPHDFETLALLYVKKHIEKAHPLCLFCSAEKMLVRAIIEEQRRL